MLREVRRKSQPGAPLLLPLQLLVLVLLGLVCGLDAQNPSPPHIIAFIADDLGWYDTTLRNPSAPTPSIGSAAAEGLLLDRHYVFRYCSPTRRSLLTGRFPNSISTVQPDGNKTCSDFTPLNATILSEKLSRHANYSCHMVGKGHLGYQTTDHLPINRGFDSHVGFLLGSETYSHGGGSPDPLVGQHDLWHNETPAEDLVASLEYSTAYYTAHAVDIIRRHGLKQRQLKALGASNPLFLMFCPQNVHSPYTMPPHPKSFPLMWDQTYANMLAVLDQATAEITAAVRESGMFNDTLMLWTSDNGGITRGNNHPLRGHKHDPWEGGTRAAAFLWGGVVPPSLRGSASGNKLVHISDWYPTFCRLAGVDPRDPAVFGDKEYDIDGADIWPLLTESAPQPRSITPITEVSLVEVAGVRWWKLVTLAGKSIFRFRNQTVAPDKDDGLECLSGHQPDPYEPGRTDEIVSGCPVCNASSPCLFDLLQDPSERTNLAASHPHVVKRLAAEVAKHQKPYVTGSLSSKRLAADYVRLNTSESWRGFVGPCYRRKGGGV